VFRKARKTYIGQYYRRVGVFSAYLRDSLVRNFGVEVVNPKMVTESCQWIAESYGMKPWVRQTWTMPKRSSAPILCFMR